MSLFFIVVVLQDNIQHFYMLLIKTINQIVITLFDSITLNLTNCCLTKNNK